MNNTEKFTDMEWEEIALHLSGESERQTNLLSRFRAEDNLNTEMKWKELKNMSSEKKIDVDKAWNNIVERVNIDEPGKNSNHTERRFSRSIFIRIAAVAFVILTLGSTVMYLKYSGFLSKKITLTTSIDQKNLPVDLPDGSKIYLNRNTELSYRSNFGKHKREVKLTGEAFFEISPDASKPFSVDAGNAKVKVLGTSFNVITKNAESAVEVYVKTGQVLLSDNTGSKEIVLDPEYVGTMDIISSGKTLNKNPNYMSWNTGLLQYTAQKLNVVFKDLERVYNMIIVSEDPDILDYPWTWSAQVDNQSQDTIIRLICASFTLSYIKDGNVYYLAKK